MIKLLVYGKQILIASLVFILLANTTNLTFLHAISEKTTKDWVNPAEASTAEKGECLSISEPDDVFHCDDFDWSAFHPDREFVDELCDASEDYAKNPKNCDKAYDLVEEKEQEQEQEEKAADEDALCDNEDAATTNIDMCKSDGKKDDEGKRYVNPDGGAPLYEDELTEDEKDDYTEYKPEK